MTPGMAAQVIVADARALERAAQRALYQAASETAETIRDTAPEDTGDLKRSVRVRNTPNGARIAVDAPHAGYVEAGSRPHWMPLAPLVAWVRRKGFGTTEHEVYAIAKAIQKKIAYQGTKPTYFIRSALAKHPDFVRLLQENFGR